MTFAKAERTRLALAPVRQRISSFGDSFLTGREMPLRLISQSRPCRQELIEIFESSDELARVDRVPTETLAKMAQTWAQFLNQMACRTPSHLFKSLKHSIASNPVGIFTEFVAISTASIGNANHRRWLPRWTWSDAQEFNTNESSIGLKLQGFSPPALSQSETMNGTFLGY